MKYLLLVASLVCGPAWAVDCMITEFSRVSTDASGRVMQVADYSDPNDPPHEQVIDDFTTVTNSAAFQSTTRLIKIICDAKTHYELDGTAATATSPFIPENSESYFGVRGGQVMSVYDGSS